MSEREPGVGLLVFDSGFDVQPGSRVKILIRPQCIFRGIRVLVPHPVADDFTIEEIRVGLTSQFFEEVPAIAFATDVQPELLLELASRCSTGQPAPWPDQYGILGKPAMLEVCQICQDLAVHIKHVGAQPTRFVAGIIGDYLNDAPRS